jgi:adenosine deaminase
MFVHAGELRRPELHQAMELIHIELLSNGGLLELDM